MGSATSETWAGVVLLVTCGLLTLTTIAAVCARPDERPRIVGLAAFGWGYFALARWYTYHEGPLPTVGFLPGTVTLHGDFATLPPLIRMAHDACALAFAFVGSILAGRFSRHPAAVEPEPSGGSVPGWWRKPIAVGAVGIGLIAAAMIAGWRRDAGITAGVVYLLAWALLGLAVLGAFLGAGRRREAWLGAAAFGVGYMVLAFAPVASGVLPTNHLLNAVIRPDGPRRDELTGVDLTDDDESQRVMKALELPVSLHFPGKTPLKTALEPIRKRLRESLGKVPVIYASMIDLGRIARDFDALPVTIDCESLPAKDALRLCLTRFGLTYRVQSGYIRIQADAYQPISFAEDPAMIAGHSILALLAAAVGSVAAPIVAGLCGRHRLPPEPLTCAPGPRSSGAAR